MKQIKVKIDSFQGSVSPSNEYIFLCKKGDIITVQDNTWEAIQKTFPDYFELISNENYLELNKKDIITSIGIIIITYNETNYLKTTLDSLKETIFPKEINYKIIFIDNASTDKQVIDLLENFNISGIYKEIIINKNNIKTWDLLKKGFDILYQNNIDVMMNLNPNIIVKSNWLIKIIDLLQKFPDTIISGFNNKNHDILKEMKDYYIKKTIEGINIVFKWEYYLNYIRSTFLKEKNWTWEMCKILTNYGKNFIITKPSVITYIGEKFY